MNSSGSRCKMDSSRPLVQIRIENLSRVVPIWKDGSVDPGRTDSEVFGSGTGGEREQECSGENYNKYNTEYIPRT